MLLVTVDQQIDVVPTGNTKFIAGDDYKFSYKI